MDAQKTALFGQYLPYRKGGMEAAIDTLLDSLKKAAPPPEVKVEWIILPPSEDDPVGYVGCKVLMPLKPGEFLCRGYTSPSPNHLIAEDIVATRETLPAIRASGKYIKVTAPKEMEDADDRTV